MKNAIITGTSSGLGVELVKKFSTENYNIISIQNRFRQKQSWDEHSLNFFNFHFFSEVGRSPVRHFPTDQ